MPNNKRARKPRDMRIVNGHWDYLCAGQYGGKRVFYLPSVGEFGLTTARRIHNWLGRYIAWAEQGGGKDAEA